MMIRRPRESGGRRGPTGSRRPESPASAGTTTKRPQRIIWVSSSIYSCLRREDLDLVRQREQVDRTVVDLDCVAAIEPCEGVFHPAPVVALGIVFARMGAATLGAVLGRMQRHDRLLQQVFEFERFD